MPLDLDVGQARPDSELETETVCDCHLTPNLARQRSGNGRYRL